MIRHVHRQALRYDAALENRFLKQSLRKLQYSSSHAKPITDVSPDARSRTEKLISRLPKFLQRHTRPLVNAPMTHISAFLLLHELTAVVPLFGLAAVFHYTQWMPPYVSESKWVSDGVERFGNYFRKKGWLGQDEAARYRWWGRGERGARVVVE